MGLHNICSKLDQAIIAYIISKQAGTAADVYGAKRSLTKNIPCTICWTHTARPHPERPYSGEYLAESFIEVRTSAPKEVDQTPDDPRTESDARVSNTFDLFYITGDNEGETLGDTITAAAISAGVRDFTINSVRVVEENQGFNPRTAVQQGNCWIDTIHIQSVCAPSSGLGG